MAVYNECNCNVILPTMETENQRFNYIIRFVTFHLPFNLLLSMCTLHN